jgi:magnesium transporter
MAKFRPRKKLKTGLAPGSLVFTGEQKMQEIAISAITYGEDQYLEYDGSKIEEILKLPVEKNQVIWINIDGLHDVKTVEQLCKHFGIHKLTTEDLLSVDQRPKLEEHPDYLHLVVKMFMLSQKQPTFEYEQLSFILKPNLLITFQEKTGDVFNNLRRGLKEGKGQLRKRGSDYLLYAMLDAVVDQYFLILENLGELLQTFETQLLDNPDKGLMNQLHFFRRETLGLRRSVYPLREVINRFEKINEPMVENNTKLFIRDLYDHTIQAIETVEIFRDMSTGLLDLYMNSVSNKMNEIMKVLTIMASIFIPLTFIVGIYGMNFEHMPELKWRYGYFMIMGLMFAISAGMLFFFKKKKWI